MANATGPGSGLGSEERLYRIIRSVASPLYRVLFRVQVSGAHRVPATGPAILAANHRSFFDTVVLMLSVPRRTMFVGKAEYLDRWTTRRLFPALGMIPIQRDAGRKAMAALDTAARVLQEGNLLGIYPEGTRSRDGLLHRGHTGVAQLALLTGAPVVPIGLAGTERIQPIGARVPRPFRRAAIAFGEPIDPASYGGPARRRRQQLTEDLMEAIRRLGGHAVADDFASDEPPLIRGGNESVYRVHRVGGSSLLDWESAAQRAVAAACRQWDDARVGEVVGMACRVLPDGRVAFSTELKVSVKVREAVGTPTAEGVNRS